MAKISTSYISNFSASLETSRLQAQGLPVYVRVVSVSEKVPDNRNTERVEQFGLTPDEERREEAGYGYTLPEEVQDQFRLGEPVGVQEGDEEPSAGTNSSTSGSSSDKSGSSARGTQASPQSPAQDAGSPSSPDQAPKQQSSTAPSTSGSGQGTGSSQPRQSGSSAGSQTATAATTSSASEETPSAGGFAAGGPVE